MIQPKTKEHIRRWFCLHLPKYATLAGCAAVLAGVIGVTASQLQVVTVSDSHGKKSTVVSAERKVVDLIAQAGITPNSSEDELVVTETSANSNSIHILRAYDVPVTADGQTVSVITTGGTVEEVLAEGGITLGADDEVEPARGTVIEEGDSITIRRVRYDTYTVEEVIPAEVVYEYTSLFYRQKSYEQVMQEGSDGLDEVTYRDKYVDGEWVEKVELNRTTVVGHGPEHHQSVRGRRPGIQLCGARGRGRSAVRGCYPGIHLPAVHRLLRLPPPPGARRDGG